MLQYRLLKLSTRTDVPAPIPTSSPVFPRFNWTAVQADLACDYDPMWLGLYFATYDLRGQRNGWQSWVSLLAVSHSLRKWTFGNGGSNA